MEGPEIDTGTCGRGAFRTIREASRGRLKHLVPSLERLFPSLATAVLAGPAHGEDGVTTGRCPRSCEHKRKQNGGIRRRRTALLSMLLLEDENEPIVHRRLWVRPWIARRQTQGSC